MPFYRPALTHMLLLCVPLLFILEHLNKFLTSVLIITMLSLLFVLVMEMIIGGLQLKGCSKFLLRKGFEIHVSDEAKRDPSLYIDLVASKILKALLLNQPAYIVAHSQNEKAFLESIPGVQFKEADFYTKLVHHIGVSSYSKVPGKTQKLNWIQRFKDIKRRWNYGCSYYQVPVSDLSISYLQNSGRIVAIPKTKTYLLLVLGFFIAFDLFLFYVMISPLIGL